MLTDEFWDLIDEVRTSGAGDMDRLAAALADRVRPLPRAEISGFAAIWDEAMDAAYVWPLWDAAEFWLGWLGEEAFRDFRRWLISRGRAEFDRIVADPDRLADFAADRESPVAAVWDDLVAIVAGYQIGRAAPIVPGGERVDMHALAAVAARFPRLAALPTPAPRELPVMVGPSTGTGWSPSAAEPEQAPLFARFRPRGGTSPGTASR